MSLRKMKEAATQVPEELTLWENDGRSFASRVLVLNLAGRYLYRTNGEAALSMCRAKAALPVRDGGKRITHIVHLRTATPNETIGPADASILTNPGQRYVFRERVGDPNAWEGLKCYSLRQIPKANEWAFRLAQSDCLSDPV